MSLKSWPGAAFIGIEDNQAWSEGKMWLVSQDMSAM